MHPKRLQNALTALGDTMREVNAATEEMRREHDAQLGNLNRAKAHLSRATKIDQKLSMMALCDPQLEPLWDSLAREA
jgi:Sec-independent protein translocase protein TatA